MILKLTQLYLLLNNSNNFVPLQHMSSTIQFVFCLAMILSVLRVKYKAKMDPRGNGHLDSNVGGRISPYIGGQPIGCRDRLIILGSC